MPTTDEYLDRIVATAQPTPRSPGGVRLNITISLYAKGHSAVDAPSVGVPMSSDRELVRSLEAVVTKLRNHVRR